VKVRSRWILILILSMYVYIRKANRTRATKRGLSSSCCGGSRAAWRRAAKKEESAPADANSTFDDIGAAGDRSQITQISMRAQAHRGQQDTG
jgi:hypothetical protein